MRVLLVDDDLATLDVMIHSVHWDSLGVKKVFSAYNITLAEEILQREEVDIVVSDIEMPRGTGLDLLKWYRSRQLDGEFLFLTCHESFDYATNAIKLGAAEYLLKPFEVGIMEEALRKMIRKVQEKKSIQEDVSLGQWTRVNQRQVRQAFLTMILEGSTPEEAGSLRFEQEKQPLNETDRYRMVVSRVTDMEADQAKMQTSLIRFMLENMHADLFCPEDPEAANVVCFDLRRSLAVVTVCREEDTDLLERCRKLQEQFQEKFSGILTCCLTRPCGLGELASVYRETLDLMASHVSGYGKCYEQEGVQLLQEEVSALFDPEKLNGYLEKQDKRMLLNYLKSVLGEKAGRHVLNDALLQQGQQEIQQAVYLYLARNCVPAAGLFADPAVRSLTEKAGRSVIDLIRWVNYLTDRVYAYEEEARKGQNITEKINQYVRDHYAEDIGRTEIADEFGLTPEYLSKMYRKQTGVSLKDYINEYRIGQAKLLLKNEDLRIGDVAELVGFDNFTYFSTLFKKYTGMTPNQYRK